jgi:PAS domain-containing protein
MSSRPPSSAYESDMNNVAAMNSEMNNVAAMNDKQFNASLDDLVMGNANAGSLPSGSHPRWQTPSLANLDSLTGTGTTTAPSTSTGTQVPSAATGGTGTQVSQLANQHSSLMMMAMPPAHAMTSTGSSLPLNLASMMASANASNPNQFPPSLFTTGLLNTSAAGMTPPAAVPSSWAALPPPPAARPTLATKAALASGEQDLVASAGMKRPRDYSEVSENEDETSRRRQDRNVREQQRSQQITSQISNLKQVLQEANVQFKHDKHSTLVSVVDYVKQLQERSTMLEVEHAKLLDTITKTTDIVNSQHLSSSGDPSADISNDLLTDGTLSPFEEEAMVLVRGIDYHSVFAACPLACSIASVDGRFLDCNKAFEELTCYTREELFPSECDNNGSESDLTTSDAGKDEHCALNKSFFNILNQNDLRAVFTAMSEMLRRSVMAESMSSEICLEDCWSGCVHIGRFEQKKVRLLHFGHS